MQQDVRVDPKKSRLAVHYILSPTWEPHYLLYTSALPQPQNVQHPSRTAHQQHQCSTSCCASRLSRPLVILLHVMQAQQMHAQPHTMLHVHAAVAIACVLLFQAMDMAACNAQPPGHPPCPSCRLPTSALALVTEHCVGGAHGPARLISLLRVSSQPSAQHRQRQQSCQPASQS
jgi:hypothetical protein